MIAALVLAYFLIGVILFLLTSFYVVFLATFRKPLPSDIDRNWLIVFCWPWCFWTSVIHKRD